MYSIRFCIVFALLTPSLLHAAMLGIPGPGTTLSGIGVISGWKCQTNGDLTVRFDGGQPIPLLYGSERTDVRENGQCLENDHDNVGFVAIWNWGNLGAGEHTAIAYDNGVEFARNTFTVTTLGMGFLTGASTSVSVPDFPHAGETTTFEWNQTTQHLEAVMVREGVGPEDLNYLLEPMRKKYELPALAGGIVHAGELIGLGAVGVRRVGSPERVTVQDQWRLLSCTKAMTATLIALLVEDGVLSWQTTIGEAFPDLLGTIDAAWHSVTVEQLLAHRSGLPDPVANSLIDLESPPTGTMIEQRLQIVGVVLQQAPSFPPGSRFEYSVSAGYTVAGAIAEAATGKVWEELMAERLFVPLRMASADFGAPGHPETNSQPRAHAGRTPVEPGGPDDVIQRWSLAGPAGLVHSSIEDWGKFVAMQLAGARGESSFLKPETFQKLHTPAKDEPEATQIFPLHQGVGQNYGLGWVVSERSWADGRVLSHPGYYGGYAHTFMAVVPNKDFAVLLATNVDKWGSLEEAAWTLIQHFLGE